MNQSIWLAPEKNRSIYIANYTLVVMLIGTAAAYLCGGAFMQLTRAAIPAGGLPLFDGIKFSSYHFLFIISAVIRLLVLVFVFRGYQEYTSSSALDILRDLKASLAGTIMSKKEF